MLNNIVDNLEQRGQQNIVQCCFHQARTGCAFFAVYTRKNHHVVASCQQVVQRLLRSGCSNVVGAAFNNPGYQFVPGC